MAQTLRNEGLSPLARLRAYIDANVARLTEDQMCNGCLFGNFTAEASDHSDLIRDRLLTIFADVQQSIAECLTSAVKAGELPADFKCAEVAGFIVSSLQGANLLSKAERSPAPIERFAQVLFTQVLR
ncbi:TetR family transcriptional regulator C-terminal domain-containing protein [Tardiphaga sp. 37S4]|nr:TetR family transcriptional regulator C-terminal domain-containing protein [Tardiphaga sp. 37S4]